MANGTRVNYDRLVRSALHPTEWRIIQALCEDVSRMEGVAWAGLTEAESSPRWLAFAGSEEQVPLEPEADQVFHQLEAECPPTTALVALEPARPRRTYLCGIVLPAGLTLVVVPNPDSASGAEGAVRAACAGLHRLRDSFPAGQPPPSGMPPASSPPPTPLPTWDWVPLPGARRKS